MFGILRPASLLFSAALPLLAGCAGYAVTLNEQTLYDPRERVTEHQFADPGLQACVNMALQQQRVEAAENLTVLSCSGLEIRSLAGLEALGSLQFLDVSGNRLTHLDPLRSLSRLRSVTASANPLNEISALFSVTGLTTAVFTGSNEIPCAHLDRLAERLGNNLTRPERCAS